MKSDRNSTTEKSEYREKHHGQGACAAVIILLALASGPGYLFLTEKITAGERQIADGQRQLEQGQSALEVGKEKLEVGKEKLEVGKRELAEGKKEYKQAKDNPFVVLADKLLRKGLQGGARADRRRRQAGCQRRQAGCQRRGPGYRWEKAT